MPRYIQSSFARGELGPQLHARIGVSAYEVGCKTLLNMFVQSSGSASNRAGLRWVGPCKNHDSTALPPRLIEFKFNTSDTYILEFGEQYMRVVRNDALVLNSAKSVTAYTAANPGVITINAHGYTNGMDVYVTGFTDPDFTFLNNRYFTVANVTTNTFTLKDQVDGTDVSTLGLSWTADGSVSSVFELSTPYPLAAVQLLRFTQSANVMTLTHSSYAVRELSRTDHNAWTLSTVTFAPTQPGVTGMSIAPGGSAATYTYCVTAVNEETDEESLGTYLTTTTSAAVPNNTISWTAATGARKYVVYRYDNGIYGYIGETEVPAFHDDNLETDLSLTPPTARNPFNSSDKYPSVVSYYNQRRVFANTNQQPDTMFYSVVGSQSNMSQSSPRRADDAITATLNALEVNAIQALVPQQDLIIFTSGSEWIANSGEDVAFSAENLKQKPQTVWGSSPLRPIIVGDRILYVTENLTYIRSYNYELSVDGYRGNDMTVFSPHIFADQVIFDWCYTRWPEPIVYCVREDGMLGVMTFNPEQEIVAWARWKTNGQFLSCASVRPGSTSRDAAAYFIVQRLLNGKWVRNIERVATRRFTDVRSCFFVDCGLQLDSPKTITAITSADPCNVTSASHGFSDGDEVDISEVEWAFTYDSDYNEVRPDHLNNRRFYVADATTDTFNLVSRDPSDRVDIVAATQANPVVITTFEAHNWANGDAVAIFGVVGMTELNGKSYKVSNVTEFTAELQDLSSVDVDGTGYTAYSQNGLVYPCVDGSQFATYLKNGEAREAFGTFANLWHLEGEEVVVLADGNVVRGLTVANGSITLPRKASRVSVGLPYVADFESLNPEFPIQGQTTQGRPVRAPVVTVRLHETRGLRMGPDFYSLTQMKQRQFEPYGLPTELLTGDKEMEIFSDWESGGRVAIRQADPLPLTILAVIPELDIGDDAELQDG